jgi:DNA-directed RNA polymerase subunit RPC12/RpoP
MSDFKFNCPACGQRILGDSGYVGRQIDCPTCKKKITVPKPSAATAAPVATPQSAASTIPLPAMQESRPGPARLCPLAVASLIGVLVPPVGVVCGHLALSRIHKDSSLKGATLATVALVLSYFALAAIVVWYLVKHVS